jgi:hypothetical protein
MSALLSTLLTLVVGGVLGGLASDDVRGRIRRRVEASVERTIASLQPDLEPELAEKWRAELAGLIGMPLVSACFAYDLRHIAAPRVGESAPAMAQRLRSASPRLSVFKLGVATLDRWIAESRLPHFLRLIGLVAGVMVAGVIVVAWLAAIVIGFISAVSVVSGVSVGGLIGPVVGFFAGIIRFAASGGAPDISGVSRSVGASVDRVVGGAVVGVVGRVYIVLSAISVGSLLVTIRRAE